MLQATCHLRGLGHSLAKADVSRIQDPWKPLGTVLLPSHAWPKVHLISRPFKVLGLQVEPLCLDTCRRHPPVCTRVACFPPWTPAGFPEVISLLCILPYFSAFSAPCPGMQPLHFVVCVTLPWPPHPHPAPHMASHPGSVSSSNEHTCTNKGTQQMYTEHGSCHAALTLFAWFPFPMPGNPEWRAPIPSLLASRLTSFNPDQVERFYGEHGSGCYRGSGGSDHLAASSSDREAGRGNFLPRMEG
jgi:hypothetical protein